ncbi:MAG: hypothetical protein E3K29_03965 [Candidatus Brocadia sp.]|nr:hypothetical protein [Candidatus Brocadia sp.]
MITKRTVILGEKRFLEFIDDNTGVRVKQIEIDEIRYNRETAEILIQGYMVKNPGTSYSKAFAEISAKYPILFSEYFDDVTYEHYVKNPGASM